MIYWCELISGRTDMPEYKIHIADKTTPYEECIGFNSTRYAQDPQKGQKVWQIVKQNNLEQYNK